MSIPDGYVQITEVEFTHLCHDSQKLAALEAANVNNWDGYDIAMELLRDWENES